MSLLIYFIPYLYLFVCLIVHCWRQQNDKRLVIPGGKIGALLAGVSGTAITAFAMIVALFPPPGTTEIWQHEAKLVGGSLFLVGIGVVIYWRAKRLRQT
jgi:amino acid transporter